MANILEDLQALKLELEKCPFVKIITWKIGEPTNEVEFEKLKKRLGWKNLPESMISVYKQVNGMQIEWVFDNKKGRGCIDLKPLHEIHSFPTWFDYPQPMEERENFYILDFFVNESQAGFYALPKESPEDEVLIKFKNDEFGDNTNLNLEDYLDLTISSYGIQNFRYALADPTYVYKILEYPNDYNVDNPDDLEKMEEDIWPFEDLEDYYNFISNKLD